MAAQDIGRMLMGMSAGMQGRGNEFIRGIRQDEAVAAQQQRQAKADAMAQEQHDWTKDEQRRKAMWQDALTVQNLIGQGDLAGANELLGDREMNIKRLGGNPDQTRQIQQRLNDAIQTGDFESFNSGINSVVEAGYSAGFGKRPKVKQQIIDGKLVTIGADGVTASPIQGLETKASKAEDLKLENLRLKNAKARQDLSAITQKPALEAGDIRAIQKDFTSLIQEPTQIRNAAARLTKLGESKSPTDQLAAVFTFMKSLDPTSVVREGEQQQARSTGGLADEMVGYVNQIQGGGSLPPDVFNNMINTAKRLSNQATIDSRAQVTDWVDTFGETLPARVREKTLGRIPSLFKMDTKTPVAGGGQRAPAQQAQGGQGAPARSETDILNQYGIQ